MFAAFFGTAKAWMAGFVTVFGTGLGTLIVHSFEAATKYDIPATYEAVVIGAVASPFVWLATYLTKNT